MLPSSFPASSMGAAPAFLTVYQQLQYLARSSSAYPDPAPGRQSYPLSVPLHPYHPASPSLDPSAYLVMAAQDESYLESTLPAGAVGSPPSFSLSATRSLLVSEPGNLLSVGSSNNSGNFSGNNNDDDAVQAGCGESWSESDNEELHVDVQEDDANGHMGDDNDEDQLHGGGREKDGGGRGTGGSPLRNSSSMSDLSADSSQQTLRPKPKPQPSFTSTSSPTTTTTTAAAATPPLSTSAVPATTITTTSTTSSSSSSAVKFSIDSILGLKTPRQTTTAGTLHSSSRDGGSSGMMNTSFLDRNRQTPHTSKLSQLSPTMSDGYSRQHGFAVGFSNHQNHSSLHNHHHHHHQHHQPHHHSHPLHHSRGITSKPNYGGSDSEDVLETPLDASESDAFREEEGDDKEEDAGNAAAAAAAGTEMGDEQNNYPWLQCTRYHPPKLQRSKKKDGGGKKRKLGRNPRVPFTKHQVAVLEEKFRRTHYLSSMDVADLSTALTLSEPRVKIWFQNRRARERREREASQRAQLLTQKTYQPLSIPSVTWALTSQLAPSPFTAQYGNDISFRARIFSSALSAFSTPVRHEVAASAAAEDAIKTPCLVPGLRNPTATTTSPE